MNSLGKTCVYAPEGDDDELSVLRPIFDIVRDDRHVPEIERGVDLVHKVQRRRLVHMQSEDEREGAQSLSSHPAKTRRVSVRTSIPESERERQNTDLLPAGQVGDVLPALLGRHHTEDDTLRERIHAIHQLKFSVSTKGDHLPFHSNPASAPRNSSEVIIKETKLLAPGTSPSI